MSKKPDQKHIAEMVKNADEMTKHFDDLYGGPSYTTLSTPGTSSMTSTHSHSYSSTSTHDHVVKLNGEVVHQSHTETSDHH
ncbi:MAG: hypothetical protein EOP33_03365 [Rickettsiaceae bacterium]|nr:MAG: hypothetical protein EOP33_03365 [Rickettsiaceae bacterium]